MKKLSIVLLAVLLVASLIISCDNSTQVLTDELVEVQLGTQAGSRALSSSVTLEQISDSSLTWYYSATKKSQTEFTTGATTGTEIALGTTKTFSQGKWDFELWAMKNVVKDTKGAVTDFGKKVYYGKLTDVLITKSSSPVPVVVNVSPYVENENGTLVFDDVKIKAATSTAESLVTVVPNTVKIGTNNYTLDANGDNEGISLAPGQHDVLVAFIGSDGATYASETITITIYSNRVTTLTGMVDEETASAEITVIGTAATVKNENVESIQVGDTYVNHSLTISAPVTPSKAVDKTESGVTVQNTDVTFDEGAFNLTGTSDKAELRIDTTSIEDSNFAINATDAESGLTSVAGLDIVLKVNDSDVTTFNENKYATVSTYIAKNLTSVGVRYKNPTTGDITSYTIQSVSSEPTTITDDGYYIASTGKLVFKTTHFSEYYVVANARAYIKENNTAYSSLTDAITAVDNDQTIVILDSYTMQDSCNHPVTGTAKENSVSVNNGKTFSIDFNAKTVTGKMYIQSGFVTLKNGVFGGLDQTINIYGNTEDSEYNSVTIENGMKITTDTDGYGIILRDRGGDQKMYYGTTVNVNGIINAGTSGIFVMGNIINAPESTVNPMSVFVGSKAVINADEIAINQNGLSYVVINDGARLTAGETAVEVRAGALEINGGIFFASATPTEVSSNGSGASTVGAAVAIAQHTTAQPIRVEVNGGTFTAYTALNEADPEGNNSRNVSIEINGGTFKKLDDQTAGVVVNSDSNILTICGGTFDTDPSRYVADGYSTRKVDTLFEVVPAKSKIGGNYYPDLNAAIIAASDGDTIELLDDISMILNEGNTSCISIQDKGITIDGNGKAITLSAGAPANSTYGIFITGDSSKTVTIKNTTINTTNLERAIRTEGSIGFKIEGSTITTNGVGVHVKGANKADICGTTITVSVIEKYSAHLRTGVMVGGPDAVVTVNGCTINATNSKKTDDTNTWCKGLYVGNSAFNGELTVNNTKVEADWSICIDGTQNENNPSNKPSKMKINGGEYSGRIGSPSGYDYKSLIITGGTFTGNIATNSFNGKGSTLVISGGKFSFDPSSYVDTANYNVSQNGLTWTVNDK